VRAGPKLQAEVLGRLRDGIFGADGGRAQVSGLSAAVRASGSASRLLALAVPRLRRFARPDRLGRDGVTFGVFAVIAGGRRSSVVASRRLGVSGDHRLEQRA